MYPGLPSFRGSPVFEDFDILKEIFLNHIFESTNFPENRKTILQKRVQSGKWNYFPL